MQGRSGDEHRGYPELFYAPDFALHPLRWIPRVLGKCSGEVRYLLHDHFCGHLRPQLQRR